MRKLLLATALSVSLGGAASAADLALKSRPFPPPVWSWSGFYLGINGGGSIGHGATTDSQVFTAPGLTAVPLFNESFNHSPVGGLGGFQGGYNWQVSPAVVLGVEADWQWTSQQDTATVFGCGAQNLAFFFLNGQGFNNCLSDQQKLRWFGTARARAGVTTGDWLWYVTGGGAWGSVQDNLTLTIANADPTIPNPLLAGTSVAGFTHNKSGWTVGGGVETRLWGALTAKLEYLYVDLGSYTDTFVMPGNAAVAPGSTLITNTTSRFTDHIIRAGLNWKFGPWGGVMAAY